MDVIIFINYYLTRFLSRDHWLLIEALVLLIMMVMNTVFIAWDSNQRENEMLNKAKKIISNIKGRNLWTIFKERL